MNRYLKILIVFLLSLVSLLVAAGGIVSYYFKDEVINFAIESINKYVTSRIQVRSVHFSAFHNFPFAAVEFRHVVMSPAKGFDTLSFESERSRNMLVAESVFAELNIFRLLTGDYNISRIEVCDGSVNLLTDKKNRHNFIFWKIPEESTVEGKPIELENVTLRNMDVYYAHRQSNTIISLYADRAQLSGRFSSRQYSMIADWQGSIRLFSLDGDVFVRDKDLELSGKLDVDDNIFTIRRSDLTLAKVKTTVSGNFLTGNDIVLDLLVENQQVDYASLVSMLPETYRKTLHDYPGKGSVNFSASIKGKAGNGAVPKIEAQFGMKQGQIAHRQSKIRLTGLSFTGTFTNGEKKQRATSMLKISDLSCDFGGGTITGSFTLQNFVKPKITARISTVTDLQQLYDFIAIRQISSAKGGMRCELTINTRLKNMVLAKTENIEQLAIDGTILFRDASVHLSEPDYRLSDINGSLQVGDRLTSSNLSLTLNGNDLKIDGYMDRWLSYLLKKSDKVYFKANVSSHQICVDSLLMKSKQSQDIKNPNQESAAPLLPANIEFETHLETEKFRYQKFEAERMKTHLVYRPRALEVQAMTFSAMSGKMTGKGLIANRQGNQIHVSGEAILDRMAVKQLFRTFDNFGQDVLRAEHVKGDLSGSLDFAIGWDNKMILQPDKLMVEGLINLNNGELINFEPMNNLSRFVALEELQNIRFSNLNMHILVKDRKITFPQTDIRTSAFDITGSGEHLFANSYTYRVKILLSELLAAKARKVKHENSENEYIEDGGKRAALYLKIDGKDSDFNISYDKQSAKASVSEDIRNEKQTLKGILKEEFGWFKKDTTVTVKPTKPDNSGKLRFTFDEDE